MARTDRGEARSARPAKRTGAARRRSRAPGAARGPPGASRSRSLSPRPYLSAARAGQRRQRQKRESARSAAERPAHVTLRAPPGCASRPGPRGEKLRRTFFRRKVTSVSHPPAAARPDSLRLSGGCRHTAAGASLDAAPGNRRQRNGSWHGAGHNGEPGASQRRWERSLTVEWRETSPRSAKPEERSPRRAPPANSAGRPPAPSAARTAPTRPVPPRRAAPPAHLTRPHLTSRRGPARSRPVRPPRAEALSVLRGRDAGTRAAPRMGGGAPPPGVPERGCSAPQDPRRLPGGRGTASAAPPLPWLRLRLAPTAWLGPRLLPPGGRTALRRARGRRGATGRGAWPPRPALERLLAAPRAGGAGVGGDARRNPRGAGNGTFRRRRGADVPGGRWAMAGGRRSPWTPGPLLLPPPWVPPGWQRPVRARGGSPLRGADAAAPARVCPKV